MVEAGCDRLRGVDERGWLGIEERQMRLRALNGVTVQLGDSVPRESGAYLLRVCEIARTRDLGRDDH